MKNILKYSFLILFNLMVIDKSYGYHYDNVNIQKLQTANNDYGKQLSDEIKDLYERKSSLNKSFAHAGEKSRRYLTDKIRELDARIRQLDFEREIFRYLHSTDIAVSMKKLEAELKRHSVTSQGFAMSKGASPQIMQSEPINIKIKTYEEVLKILKAKSK